MHLNPIAQKKRWFLLVNNLFFKRKLHTLLKEKMQWIFCRKLHSRNQIYWFSSVYTQFISAAIFMAKIHCIFSPKQIGCFLLNKKAGKMLFYDVFKLVDILIKSINIYSCFDLKENLILKRTVPGCRKKKLPKFKYWAQKSYDD